VIRLTPGDASAYRSRANSYARKNLYDRALQDCDQAIKLNPNDALAYRYRATAKLALKDQSGHDADMAKAATLKP
jgi:tetratricopeptide (TPR) repeat protein